MKGYIIFENFNKLIECKEILDGGYTCVFGDGTFSGVINRVTGARCNKDDTYDFEVGALIALMKMCGVDKVVRAYNEAFSEDTFKTYATIYERELNELKKDFDKVKDLKDLYKKNYFEGLEEIKRLEEENEKLKLDCEKLQHGYIDTDMIFCGGRQNGKQYTALVNLFKKLDQKKVDTAYKEAYNTTLPVWQKEVLNQMYDVYKESKEKPELPRTLDINGTVYRKSIQIKDFGEQINKLTVDSHIEQNRAFTRKCVDEWVKLPTKREEMWNDILSCGDCEHSKYVKVKKEDLESFVKECNEKKIFDIIGYELHLHESWFADDSGTFQIFRKPAGFICASNIGFAYKDTIIDYLPPMRWDLFKKGRLAVKVNYDNYKEFCEACEKELGKKPSTYLWDNVAISICKKDGNFQIFTIEHQKGTGRKIVNWEDVK